MCPAGGFSLVQQAPYHAPSEGPEELKLPITKEMDSAIPARTAEICRDNWPCYAICGYLLVLLLSASDH
jgi:hypothetical protein